MVCAWWCQSFSIHCGHPCNAILPGNGTFACITKRWKTMVCL